MFKKTSKYLIFSNVLIVFSLLLVSCQSMIATTEEMDRKQAVDAWGDNLTVHGESYFERYLEEIESKGLAYLQASGSLIELRSDVPFEADVMEMESKDLAYLQASGSLIELRSDVPFEADVMEMESKDLAYLQASGSLIELRSDVPFEADVMEMESKDLAYLQASGSLIELRSDVPFEADVMEMESKDLAYLQASGSLIELRSDVPFEADVMEMESKGLAYLQASGSLIELRSDVPFETEVMVDAFTPGIVIRRTWLEARTFLTVYTIVSDGPGWVVFHADKDGEPGAILDYIFVGSGTNSIARTEDVRDISSEQFHVMLHKDFGRLSVFEFPGPDGPVYEENEIINALCFCPF
jgi:hypothetical protein